MKRVYLAAALIVASGAGVGYLLRPPSAEISKDKAAEAPRQKSAPDQPAVPPAPQDLLPPPLDSAAAGRPDCFYMRVAYAHSLKGGKATGESANLRQQGARAGCWIPDED